MTPTLHNDQKQIFCEKCGDFQPLIEEEPKQDELNEHPWGDLLCGGCHLVIATIRLVPFTGEQLTDNHPQQAEIDAYARLMLEIEAQEECGETEADGYDPEDGF